MRLPVQRGQGERKQQTGGRAAEGEDIGDDHVIVIDEERTDHDRAQHCSGERLARREKQPAGKEQPGGQQLDGRVTEAEGPAAAARTATEEDPAEHGNVVIPRNGLAAAAMGAGPDHGFALGDAVNANVQETADAGADDRGEQREEPRSELGDLVDSFHD